jgi:outer membrane protein assembly factor BamB
MKQLSLLLIAALAATPVSAQEWTRFRGPNGTGISEAKGIPTNWTEKDFRWRVEIPGESHSQPVIWGERVFVTSASKDQGRERFLVCLSKADGKELWRKTYTQPDKKPGNGNSGYANGSAVVDAERVIAPFVSESQFIVRAYDHAGKDLWERNLGPFKSQHGYGASPMIHDGKVVIANDQDDASFVAALDVKTGKTVWQTPRGAAPQGAAYGTPCVLERGGKVELLLTSKNHGVSSLDPATGKMNWESPVFNLRVAASPVVAGDVAIGSCGQGGGGGNFLAAIRLGGKGNVSSSHLAYRLDKATPYVPTPIFHDGRLYLVSDAGIGSCLEASTGKVIWSERLGTGFFASPVLVDGKLYCPTTRGEMVVWATGDQFKVLGRSPLGEGTHSTPCVDGDRLYQKTFSHLVCVGGK